ncbi:MAG: T9SS type A sorting domain-containing protein [Bernardetiaceae bacterium]|nr:T9SS type A sorting domain-containing protein [Bernardetiaceae bacterium]
MLNGDINTGTSIPSVDQMYCRNLTVSPGRTLTVAGNTNLVLVSGTLNYTGATIEVQSGGSFIQTSTSTGDPVTNGSSVFRVRRQGLGGSIAGYNYVASPVQNVAMSSITTSSILPTVRWKFDETGLTFNSRWVSVPGTEILQPGRGYLVITPGMLTFSGQRPFNQGGSGWSSSIAITRTDLPGGNGYNIIGNPFPSDLDMTEFVSTNGVSGTDVITGEYWFWHETTPNGTGTIAGGAGNFVACSGLTDPDSAYAATGQGFYVRANNLGTANVLFTNAMRDERGPNAGNNNRTDFFRTEETRERFRLSVSHPSGLQDNLLIGFAADFTDGYDRGWDATKLDGNSRLMLAAIQASQRYAIAALPKPTGGFELPLTLQIGASGDYTFVANRVTNHTTEKLFLEDRQTGEYYYLDPNRAHTLRLEAGNYRERFYLRRANEVVDKQNDANLAQAEVYAYANELIVQAKTEATVQIYNLMGQLLASYPRVVNEARLKTNVPAPGVYLVKVITATGITERRVLLTP